MFLDLPAESCYHVFPMRTHLPRGTHEARIMRFADGDTVVCLVRCDFGVWVEKYVRLEGIESWELGGADDAKAVAAREELNRLLRGVDCLVHRSQRGHDLYGRIRGRITVGEADLAGEIVRLKLGWYATRAESAATHAAGVGLAAAACLAAASCTVARDASTLVMLQGSSTNAVVVTARQSAELPTHPWAMAVLIVAGIAAVVGLIWLVHNRGKLVGLATKIAAV